MNREQMIAWLTLEGWVLSCDLSSRRHSFFVKRPRPDFSRIVIYGDIDDNDSRYLHVGPYSPGSEVDEVTRNWDELDDASLIKAYEGIAHG